MVGVGNLRRPRRATRGGVAGAGVAVVVEAIEILAGFGGTTGTPADCVT